MKLGFIGLGRMGMNMVRRLLHEGHEVVAYNRTKEKVEQVIMEGAEAAVTLEEFAEKLQKPRILWVMLPAGTVTSEHIFSLRDILSPEDIIIDGVNFPSDITSLSPI